MLHACLCIWLNVAEAALHEPEEELKALRRAWRCPFFFNDQPRLGWGLSWGVPGGSEITSRNETNPINQSSCKEPNLPGLPYRLRRKRMASVFLCSGPC